MANIGYLNPLGNGCYRGRITCLAFNRAVQIVPAPESNNPRAPAFIIHAQIDRNSSAQVGALFQQTSRSSGEVFYQGTIDDPSMDKPLNIAAFSNREGGFNVAWTRNRKRQDYAQQQQEQAVEGADYGLGESTADQGEPLNDAGKGRGKRRTNKPETPADTWGMGAPMDDDIQF